MLTYLKLDELQAVSTVHATGLKKILSSGRPDRTRITQIAWGKLEPAEIIPAHKHADMDECFFFIKGIGEMMVNGTPYQLSPGTFINVPARAEHILTCKDETLEFFYFGQQVYEKNQAYETVECEIRS